MLIENVQKCADGIIDAKGGNGPNNNNNNEVLFQQHFVVQCK